MGASLLPVCRFKLSNSDSQPSRLGWVSKTQGRVYELPDNLNSLLKMRSSERLQHLGVLQRSNVGAYPLNGVVLQAPVESQEIWATGTNYSHSSASVAGGFNYQDIYEEIYRAQRPSLFLKSTGWRCVGPDAPVKFRQDSDWNVPNPELTLVIDAYGSIAGYTIGNDVSARAFEQENPLYLSQARMYDGSCAIGPWIVLAEEIEDVSDINIGIVVERNEKTSWGASISTARLRRTFEDLVSWLYRGLQFPRGALLMTGSGLLPPREFTLQTGDIVTIEVEDIGTLNNPVIELPTE